MKIGTRILVALGAAEALMMANWARVFDRGLGYFYTHQPTGMYAATYALMAILAVIAFACTFLPTKARWLLIPVAVFMLDNVRIGLALHALLFPVLIIAILFGIRNLVKKEKTTWLRAGTLTFELLGYVGIATMLAGVTLLRSPHETRRVYKGGVERARPKIVLAIFDELDPVHALEKWPTDRSENEFQKLAKRGLNMTNCAQPGPETLYSLPAMTIGQKVDLAKAASPNVLNLIVDGKKREWAEKPNIIEEAKETYGRASILGWYHPYDRIFKNIQAQTFERVTDRFDVSFWIQANFLVEHPFRLIKINTQSPMLNAAYAKWQKEMIEEYHARVAEFVDEHNGLIILHIPCPHGPYVMNPIPGDPLGTDPASYYGNVEYAGKILNTIENSLKKSALGYTLIVTSDHNLRIPLNGVKPCGRVPLIISGPNIGTPTRSDAAVRGEHIADLIRLLMAKPNPTENEIIGSMHNSGR